MNREMVEWTNTWRYQANNSDIERWLLIGDSVTREYRGRLQGCCRDKIAVDFFGTSYSIEDPMFVNDLLHFVQKEEYQYSACIINIGAHHGYYYGFDELDAEYKNYQCCFRNLIRIIKMVCGKVWICSCTPQVKQDDLFLLDDSINIHIKNRNSAIYYVAQESSIKYIDFYSISSKFRFRDPFHFFGDAYSFFAESIYNEIKGKGKVVINWTYFSDLVQFNQKIISTPVYIYGAGKRGQMLVDYIKSRKGMVRGFVVSDNESLNEEYCGIPVIYRSDYLRNYDGDSIIIKATTANIDRINEHYYCELDEGLWKVILMLLEIERG